jgi:hypothetical protein
MKTKSSPLAHASAAVSTDSIATLKDTIARLKERLIEVKLVCDHYKKQSDSWSERAVRQGELLKEVHTLGVRDQHLLMRIEAELWPIIC